MPRQRNAELRRRRADATERARRNQRAHAERAPIRRARLRPERFRLGQVDARATRVPIDARVQRCGIAERLARGVIAIQARRRVVVGEQTEGVGDGLVNGVGVRIVIEVGPHQIVRCFARSSLAGSAGADRVHRLDPKSIDGVPLHRLHLVRSGSTGDGRAGARGLGVVSRPINVEAARISRVVEPTHRDRSHVRGVDRHPTRGKRGDAGGARDGSGHALTDAVVGHDPIIVFDVRVDVRARHRKTAGVGGQLVLSAGRLRVARR